MQEVLALTLQSMQQDMQRLDRIGNNLANALTPGYQREMAISQPLRLATNFSSVVDRLQGTGASGPGASNTASLAPMLVQTDARPGTLKATGQALDVALSGPGYFEVRTDHGPAYTRNGSFHLDSQGRLVNGQGFPVMGAGGDIYLQSAHPTVDAAGNVYDASNGSASTNQATGAGVRGAGANAIAKLKVVQITDTTTLQRQGDGLLTTSAPPEQMNDVDIQIRQGFVENANVSSMQEMVQLVQAMRHFESMQKVTLAYDDMTGQAIRKLGELS